MLIKPHYKLFKNYEQILIEMKLRFKIEELYIKQINITNFQLDDYNRLIKHLLYKIQIANKTHL